MIMGMFISLKILLRKNVKIIRNIDEKLLCFYCYKSSWIAKGFYKEIDFENLQKK